MKRALLFLVFISLNLQGQLNLNQQFLERMIDSLVPPKIGKSTPGVVVGIINKDKLVFSKSYGLADMSYNIPNSKEILYNLGSASKQFIGYAFSMLQAQGKLNINDPVGKYIEDWVEFDKEVTIKHLLTHTSGYRQAYAISNLSGRTIGIDRLRKQECFEVIKRQPKLEFTPGARYQYNSTAWVVLTQILENVTHNLAEDWITDNIFKPLQMNDTQIETYVGEMIKNSAESYIYSNEHKGYINTKSNRSIFGAADVYINLVDLTKWIKNYHTHEVGGKQVSDLFFEPFILNNGISSEYGLGIGLRKFHGLKRYRHIGRHSSFETDISYFPEQDLGIITISNFGQDGWISTSKIARILLKTYFKEKKEQKRIKVQKKKLRRLEGLYLASTMNKILELNHDADKLLLNNKIEVIPTSKKSFRLKNWDSFKIKLRDNKNIIQLIVENDTKDIYTKVKRWNPTTEELSEFQGNYWSEEMETIYHMALRKGRLMIKHRWLGNIELSPITKDVFKCSKGYFFKFQRKKGGISGFEINTKQSLHIFFNKMNDD